LLKFEALKKTVDKKETLLYASRTCYTQYVTRRIFTSRMWRPPPLGMLPMPPRPLLPMVQPPPQLLSQSFDGHGTPPAGRRNTHSLN